MKQLNRFLRTYTYYTSYFLQSLIGRRKPLLGGLKLSHACNLTCRACPFWRKAGDGLSFSQAETAMRELHRRGVRLLIIEGGEPFLWKDGENGLEDIVALARKLFFNVAITTNGTFPLKTRADLIWVSIDGLQPTHDRLRGPSFEKIMGHIGTSEHPAIFAHMTINRENHLEIPALVEFLTPHVKGITIQFHYPYQEGEEDLALEPQARIAVLNELIRLKKEGLPVADSYTCLKALRNNTWTCRPWMIASVDPDGTIHQGCYVQNRGKVSCNDCGFAAHTEISLAYGGHLGAILCGNRIFKRSS
ncbi:radical SAM protein [Planctomycetota bacterium]